MTETVSGAAFRDALAQFASGVTIVTAHGAAGPVGLTATAFASASLAPPLVLFCIAKRASTYAAVMAAERFGISILGEDQRWIAEQFGRSGVDRFEGISLRPGARVPLIDGALVQLDCGRYATHDAGDHTILLGEVGEAAIASGPPLVHHARRFGRFGSSL